MRKLFTERTRLVIYVEATDLERFTARARAEGRTVVEWARETLLGEFAESNDEVLRRATPVRVAERRSNATYVGKKQSERELPSVCRHGLPSCTVCGG
jgi:hypothetical protein